MLEVEGQQVQSEKEAVSSPTKEPYVSRIAALRKQMTNYGVDAYLIMTDDFHSSEYVGDYFKCREYICGFSGSAGMLLVTQKAAGLWTDGRYFIQAEEQLAGTGVQLYRMGQPGVPTVAEYLKKFMSVGFSLGYDGRTLSVAYGRQLRDAIREKHPTIEENLDLVGSIWEDRPKMSAEPIWTLEEQYAGVSRETKLAQVQQDMKKEKADVLLLSSLDDIAWLYNIRGNDIAYNPVALAFSMVGENGAVLYCNSSAVSEELRKELLQDHVMLRGYMDVFFDLNQLDRGTNLMLDPNKVNVSLMGAVPAGVNIIEKENPTTRKKAIKNPTEMQHLRKAHIKDGVAVTRLIYWLKQEAARGKGVTELTELDVCTHLEELRKEGENYLGQSFAPISAYGPHGAIVHYEPTEESNVRLWTESFLLLDTGGQYLDGTTDVTRTIAMGKLTEEQKKHYTAVLRGNLNLAAVKFKYGCTGNHFDYLARAPLWELGLDYNHGTGHGVGYCLNVHEGPNAFRLKEAGGKLGTVLEEGMLTSDEPGLYLENQYGIRLENLVLCVEAEKTEYGRFLQFETVTLVPFDRSAIVPEEMTERELQLLNEYHRRVYETIGPLLPEQERLWLEQETADIS